VEAYRARDDKRAAAVMKRLLDHGERYLNRAIDQRSTTVSAERVV